MSRNGSSKISRFRLIILVFLICLFWVALEVNLFRLQVVSHDRFMAAAENQYTRDIELPAQRGSIYDRNGNVLANNIIYYDLAADPKMVKNKSLIAKKCSNLFGESTQFYLDKLNENSNFVYLKRRVPEIEVTDLIRINDDGLIKAKNFRRSYPYKKYGAQLLGFTNIDDVGLAGLEAQFEDTLKGENGRAVLQYDGPRKISYNPDRPIERPRNGSNIYLTIDKNIQTIVENELARGVKEKNGKTGVAIVMNPNTGEVLAMASYPQFDPNKQAHYTTEQKKNRAILDIFEPGSTMKIFSSAALLQERIKNRNDIVYCENGRYRIGKHTFTDTKGHGWLSFERVVEKSSNIGMIKLVEDLPAATLHKYLKYFGFGSQTGIGLRGEEAGALADDQQWSGISKYSISIGYEISVTALQLTTAYSAVINGGYLYQPYVVDHFEDSDGNMFNFRKPEVVRQVISKEVSNELKYFMLDVVEQGTGTKAKIDGIKIGGKTGTARKFDSKRGEYSLHKYYASFVGFAPYERPKYVCAVVIDEPHPHIYGGDAAAPVFKNIIQKIINLNPDDNWNEQNSVEFKYVELDAIKDLPNLAGFERKNAEALMEAKDVDYKFTGHGSIVRNVTMKNEKIVLECGPTEIEMDKMPKLTGISLREAMSKIDHSKILVRIEGSGLVKKQSILPGTPITRRTELLLTCN
jgi:cell division protein FtsI (penicillin-binding protein 3)